MDKLSNDQGAEVGNLKRRASQDNSHGGRPNMPPPPPPPRPFNQYNPFGQQSQQPGGNPGSFFQRPRQFLRIIPYGGFQQS